MPNTKVTATGPRPGSPLPTILAKFPELLGRPFPLPVLPRLGLVAVGTLLTGTWKLHPPLLDMAALGGLREVPAGFFQIGFWGHGMNSYAFYFCETTRHRRVFLRLPYGGVYMDEERQRRLVLGVLDACASFDQLSGASEVAELEVVDWMGTGQVVARFFDGREARAEHDEVPGSAIARVLDAPRAHPVGGGLG